MKAMTKALQVREPLRLSRRRHRRGDRQAARREAPRTSCSAAGSGEILDVVGTTFTQGGKKVIGVTPSYMQVYRACRRACRPKRSSCHSPPTSASPFPMLIKAAQQHYRDLGFIYLCNPNNPTGRIVTKTEVRELLDGIPQDVPVLIDEAYHHFVDNPDYATSVPYVLEGRPVIVTRTFSKIAALAGMRLGYAIARKDIIQQMRPYSMGSINAIVKWGGVAALADTESQAKVKKVTINLRQQTIGYLKGLGYESIPSDTNFFMVHLKRQRRAGDRGVPQEGRAGRASVPADDGASARFDWNAG